MPPNDRPDAPCVKAGAAILPLEGAVNDLVPVVCRVNEPFREAVVVLVFAMVEPLVPVLVTPACFVKTVEAALRNTEGPITVLLLTSDVVETLVTGLTETNVRVIGLKKWLLTTTTVLLTITALWKSTRIKNPGNQKSHHQNG